jgi:hypothetical protein
MRGEKAKWESGKRSRDDAQCHPVKRPIKHMMHIDFLLRTWHVKSPFFKGGFRGIIKRLSNPHCPPLEKGGKKMLCLLLLECCAGLAASVAALLSGCRGVLRLFLFAFFPFPLFALVDNPMNLIDMK